MIHYPAAIIWDLDGTLIDSATDLAHALNTVLVEHGRPAIEENRIRPMIGNGVEKLVERGFSAAGSTLSEAQIEDMIRRFMSVYADCATRHTRVYRGAHSVLKKFADAGIRQGVCTNKPEIISRRILTSLSLSDFFSAISGGDTTRARKPDPLPLQWCIDTLQVDPDRSVMIGDSAVDIATARAVGMSVGLVSHGYSRKDVSTLGADFVVDKLSSIEEILFASVNNLQSSSCSKQ